jgi:hypothetical protein
VTALCQCVGCLKYLATNRTPTTTQHCTECGGSMPLASIRGTLTDPLSIECLALISEECAEVQQRIGKILRWGWDADFEGTTQQHKLESEIGDLLAAMLVAINSGQITPLGVRHAMNDKLDKFREDAAGPRQRLLQAHVPDRRQEEYVLEVLGRPRPKNRFQGDE